MPSFNGAPNPELVLVLCRVLINAQIAAGLRAYFAVTSSLVLVLLLTVVQKTALTAIVDQVHNSD